MGRSRAWRLSLTRVVRRSTFALCALSAGASATQPSPTSGTTRFVLDGNRVYAYVTFIRPDGSSRRTLAFVDMGSPSFSLREDLFKELDVANGKPVAMEVGGMPIRVPASAIEREPGKPASVGADLKVEAILPASVLARYEVVIDYRARTLTLANYGSIRPSGIAVPFHIKTETGLIAIDATIDGQRYPITVDNGSAYTWLRHEVVKGWLESHPDWERGTGAVGPANMTMRGDGSEANGALVRVPEIELGGLVLRGVGVFGAGEAKGLPGGQGLFDWYATKNPASVIGWIGGNVLRNYRLTIDYPHETLYWLKQGDVDDEPLNQVGLTLRATHGEYFVEAVATKNGVPTVEGVVPGDRLIRVDSLELANASWGEIYAAMHGAPGDRRTLVIERAGRRLTVPAAVSAF